MEDIITRIKEYMEARKLNGASLARKIDMSSVTVNQYLSGKRDRVSWEFISRILDADDKLSADWLARGKGEMDTKSSNESSRELADAKVKMLVQEGVIDRLMKLIGDKMDGKKPDKDELIVQKKEFKLG